MAEISVDCGRAVAIIDDEDYKCVSARKWYIVSGSLRTSTGIRLHHFVRGKPPAGLVTDHINGSFLDNRKINLRFVTQSLNMRSAFKDTKGYYFDKSRRLWAVSIGHQGKSKNGGRFETEEEAAQVAYDLRRRLHMGDV